MKHAAWIIIFFAIITVLVLSDPGGFKAISQLNGLGEANYQLNNSNSVRQTFSPDKDMEISGISFMVGTYTRKNRGTVSLDLFEVDNDSNKLIESRKLAASTQRTENLVDNGRLGFWFSPLKLKKGKIYSAKASVKLEDGLGLAFWKTKNKDPYSKGRAYVSANNITNPQAIEGDFVFIVYHKKTLKTVLGRFDGKSLLSPGIIFICLFFTTLLGALIVSNFPKDSTTKPK